MVTNAKGVNQYTAEVGMPNAYQPKTSYTLAEEYGVNPSTIQRDAQFSQVVDILPEEAKQNVLSGKENITRDEAKVVIEFDESTQKKFLKEVESGTPIKEAVKKVDPDDQDQLETSRQRGGHIDPDEIEIG